MKTSKTFAFRLASRDNSPKKQWKAREGGAVAGCTAVIHLNYRYQTSIGNDNGIYC